MPVFRFNKAFGITRDLKVFPNLSGCITRGAVPEVDRYKKQAQRLKVANQKNRQLVKEQRQKIKEQTEALSRARLRINENELRAAEQRVEGATKIDVPRLIVRPTAGLANRLRMTTSFQLLASYLGRAFELCWDRELGSATFLRLNYGRY